MKLLNTSLGLIRSHFGRIPFYIRFHLTHRCNYRCKMCGQNHDPGQQPPELTLNEIRTVAKHAAQLNACHLVITGGEPFLRPDLPEIISIFRQHRFSIRIQTNGGPQVTREILTECTKAGLQDISVSLDTLQRELQDEICQSKNVVENALRTLQLCKEILPYGISQANIVASAYNFTELPDLVRFFGSQGIYTYITPVMIDAGKNKDEEHFRFRGEDNSFAPESLDPEQCKRTLDELIRLRKLGIGLTNSTRFLRDYKDYLTGGRSDWRCEAGTLSLDILPDGSISICKEKPPVGNILDSGFSADYRSAAYQQLVQKTITSCKGCFYGEYREPLYAVRNFSVLWEWIVDWIRTFHRGMRFKSRGKVLYEKNNTSLSDSFPAASPNKKG
jgi:MoaA/NifB/PqqE/SkfB family radical SAM enzyme